MSSQANRVSVTSVIFMGCLHQLISGKCSEKIGPEEMPMVLQLKPLTPLFTAAASGIDLRRPPDPDTVRQIDAAMDRYGVLVFRGQPLAQDEQLAFCRAFGSLDTGLTKVTKSAGRFKHAELLDIAN